MIVFDNLIRFVSMFCILSFGNSLQNDNFKVDQGTFTLFNPYRSITESNRISFSIFCKKSVGNKIHISKLIESLSSTVLPNVWHLNMNDSWSTMKIVKSRAKRSTNFEEYKFTWKVRFLPHQLQTVCFHYEESNWYSTYLQTKREWPMNSSRVSNGNEVFGTKEDDESVEFEEDTSTVEIGPMAEHLFLNSNGFAVMLDDLRPWYIRRGLTKSLPAFLCFTIDGPDENFIPYEHSESYYMYKFTIMISKNIKTVHQNAILQYIHRPKSIPDEQLFHQPIWSSLRNEDNWIQFSKQISTFGCSNAYLHGWDDGVGKYKWVNSKMPYVISALANSTCKLAFAVVPHVGHSVDKSTAPYVMHNYNGKIVKDDNDEALLDLSNAEAAQWLVQKLVNLRKKLTKNHIELSFNFADGVMTTWMKPLSYFTNKPTADMLVRKHLNYMITRYVEVAAKLGNSVVVESAYKTQQFPLFVQMPVKTEWDSLNGLKAMLIDALTLSISGYSFFVPSFEIRNNNDDSELYIRSVQAMTFLPVINFGSVPWLFESPKVIDISKKFVQLHEKYASKIVELARNWVETGKPIIRPMWYAEPEDPNTYTIADQFMLGNDIVVAPIVEQDARQRSIYLPNGTWICKKDNIGNKFTGPTQIEIQISLEELAYFERIVY